MKQAAIALITGVALAAMTQPLHAQDAGQQQAEDQQAEVPAADESQAEEEQPAPEAEDQQVEATEPAVPSAEEEQSATDVGTEEVFANSHRWTIKPDPEGEPASDDPDADLPPRLPTIEKGGMQGINGDRVGFGAARWQAQIYSTTPVSAYTAAERRNGAGQRADWELSHRCGGTVIDQHWIVTAAHCVALSPGVLAKRRIRLGARDISKLNVNPGKTFRIELVVTHPYYVKFRGYDIALIRFAPDNQSGPNPAAAIVPIGALDTGVRFSENDRVVAMGWGKTEDVEGGQANAELLKMALNYVPESKCRSKWGAQAILSNIVLCAAGPGVATCEGDSGGPVIINERNPVLVGVVSWGNANCNGDRTLPGVYTKISAFNPWIDCVMRTRSNCASRLPPRQRN